MTTDPFEASLRWRSLFLAELARRHNERLDHGTALALALEALPDDKRGIDRPYLPQAERQLYTAVARVRERTLRIRGHEQGVTSLAFSPDGRLFVTGSRDATARLSNTETGVMSAVLRAHQDGVTSVAFSPDGTRVVTASYDGTARLWDADSGAELIVLRGHKRWITSAAFSPDGGRLITASGDGTARLWRADGGVEIAVLQGHTDAVNAAAFSPDGRWVATAAEERDGTVRLWDALGIAASTLSNRKLWLCASIFSPMMAM